MASVTDLLYNINNNDRCDELRVLETLSEDLKINF